MHFRSRAELAIETGFPEMLEPERLQHVDVADTFRRTRIWGHRLLAICL